MERLFILDADDTLWLTEHLYDEARDAVGAVAARLGINPEAFEATAREIDQRLVKTMGFSKKRFPTSCAQAYEMLAGEAATPEESAAVRGAASAVFDAPAPLVPHVEEALTQLSTAGRLALLTKGDPEVQEQRIEQSGLREVFDLIRLVAEKDSAAFLAVATTLDVDPAACWSIGNNLASDVVPALDAGMSGVVVDAYVWEHERKRQDALAGLERPGLYRSASLLEASDLVLEMIGMPKSMVEYVLDLYQPSSGVDGAEVPPCQARTRRGTPCPWSARPGDVVCGVHGGDHEARRRGALAAVSR